MLTQQDRGKTNLRDILHNNQLEFITIRFVELEKMGALRLRADRCVNGVSLLEKVPNDVGSEEAVRTSDEDGSVDVCECRH